jgi:cytochrome c oxidase assembly protein subunit 11
MTASTKLRRAWLAPVLVLVVAGMAGLSFAAVPLYRMFCAVTGYGGTPQIGPEQAPGAAGHPMTVRFDADTETGLPWTFSPEQQQVRLPVGQEVVAFYQATNHATVPVTGIALYNVTPDKIGRYFHKTACFCFDRQVLQPGQTMQFPVSFWIDPALARDPQTADVRVITLSYTFYRSLGDAAAGGALAHAGPHVGPARSLAAKAGT